VSADRIYEISIMRWCGEYVCGTVSREFYDYWRTRDEGDFADFIGALDETNPRDPEVPPMLPDGTTPYAWYDADNIAHISNAVANDFNHLRVVEMVEDADAPSGLKGKKGGFEQTWEFSDLRKTVPDIVGISRELTIDRDTDEPVHPVFMAKAGSKGRDTFAILRCPAEFDVSKLSIEAWDVDGDLVVDTIGYDGEILDTDSEWSTGNSFEVYLGDLTDSHPEQQSPHSAASVKPAPVFVSAVPPLWRVILSSIWPSLRRSLAAIFSVLGLPLFLLALISLVKLFDLTDLMTLSERMKEVTDAQSGVIQAAFDWTPIARLGLPDWVPRWLVDTGTIWASIGATALRAERNGLLAVRLTFREMLSSAGEALRRLRIDHAFFALPRLIRKGAVQWAWPLVFLYRLSQPYEVEGPGPDGETMVTTVPRKALKDFVGQVSTAISWKGQRLIDQRQVILWHALLAGGSAWLLNWTLSLI
jgi:hypothetical protein